MGRESDYSGAIDDELARVFPEIAPIAPLHFSDPDGVRCTPRRTAGTGTRSTTVKGTHQRHSDDRTDYETTDRGGHE
jgi:hypothetical protein